MLAQLTNLYRAIFARKFFYRLNKLIYYFALHGLGILNYQSAKISGEAAFLKWYFSKRVGGVVLDVGANIGSYSKEILSFNSSARIFAFEPHPKTYKKLCKNQWGENFVALNVAVGSQAGNMMLYDYEDKDGSSHASLYRDVIEGIHKSKSVSHSVPVVKLDEFLRGHQVERVSLLKIDTEGSELDVLKGAIEHIRAGKIETVHFEFNEMNVSSNTHFRDFWELLPNYDFFRLLSDGMVPIKTYCPVYCEIFAYQNIVAMLKK